MSWIICVIGYRSQESLFSIMDLNCQYPIQHVVGGCTLMESPGVLYRFPSRSAGISTFWCAASHKPTTQSIDKWAIFLAHKREVIINGTLFIFVKFIDTSRLAGCVEIIIVSLNWRFYFVVWYRWSVWNKQIINDISVPYLHGCMVRLHERSIRL